MIQHKFEILITEHNNKHMTPEEMFKEITKALEQELGYFVADIKVNQIGFLVNDEDV